MNDIYETNSATQNTAQDQNWLQRNADWLTPIATTAAQIGYNVWANDRNNQYNAEQAQINRDWQAQQSSTAYQRGYADMKAAGLNPHLAGGNGGASTGGGGQAATTGMMQADLSGLNAYALQSALTQAQVDNLNATTQATLMGNKWIDKRTKAEIANTQARTAQSQAETQLTAQQTTMARKQFEILSEEDQIRAATLMDRFEAASHSANAEKKQAEIVDEWLHTRYGQAMYRQGLSLGQISQILGITSQGMNITGRAWNAGMNQ